MSQLSSNIARALAASIVVVAVVAACGSSGGGSVLDDGSSGNSEAGASGASGTSGTPGSSSFGGTSTSGASGASGDGGSEENPDCKKLTCADQSLECGGAGDGCGGKLDCGTCKDGFRCGGVGAPSKCVEIKVATQCTPKTCSEVNVGCGPAGDGCGGPLDCGTCKTGEQCGVDGNPSHCVTIGASAADGGACVPMTVADFKADNKDCGDQNDGCGTTIHLGNCTAPEFCGGGGPSKCAVSGGGACTKKTCADYTGVCGPQPDGCGGVTASCGGCTLPEVCGGGGVPSKCGGGVLQNPDGGGACVPKTKAQCVANQCGQIADGCGGVVDCGIAACTGGTICGGGGTANVCGSPPCTKKTACPANMDCGSIADGCGGTVSCGNACIAPKICGGGGQSNVCGGGAITADGGTGGGTCTPKTAASCKAGQCGPLPDGCGGSIDCGGCSGGNTCGGGGTASMCGGACVPKSAGAACAGLNCGVVPDGCGGTIGCWPGNATTGSCPNPGPSPTFNNGDSCGAGGNANMCGGGVPCVGTYCGTQPTNCPSGTNTTQITGTIFGPNQTLPIFDAYVYVPNAPLDPVTTGVTACDTCVAPSGAPFVEAHTGTDGKFTIKNFPAPAGNGKVTLVIQKGRWRKVLQITPTSCGNYTLTAAESSFNTTQSDTAGTHIPSNNIPKFAITSGGADAMQCLLRRMGVATSEFTNPAGGGRINIYAGAGGTSKYSAGGNFPGETTLYGSNTTTDDSQLIKYDGVILTCTGASDSGGSPYAGYTDDMKSFADKGGKIFASHWHHSWIHKGPAAWQALATFDDTASQPGNNTPRTEFINTGVQPIEPTRNPTFGTDLANWLQAAGSPSAFGQVAVGGWRQTQTAIDKTKGRDLITQSANDTGPIQYSDFLTPVENTAPTKCGRFVLSDLHVSAASGDNVDNTGGGFPGNCAATTTLSDQEKVLAFMIFDLTSCVGPPPPPPKTCTALTCASAQNTGKCGPQSDGCGGLTPSCATCLPGTACGAGGMPGVCGTSSCTPAKCTAGCGTIPDGCGGLATCPACVAPATCGGGGTAGTCGTPTCVALSCVQQNIECGQTGDGCGNVITCPPCAAGLTCGGGGTPNKCGKPTCNPITTCPAGKNCGDIPDGCGGKVHCGDCAPGSTCGGGGSPNVCGQGSCTAQNCAVQGAECGQVSDQCGGVTTCQSCTAGAFCNAQNICVPPTCQPKSCTQLGWECGQTADGCGGLTPDCGTCLPGTACGAGGTPGKCGNVPCTPLSCTAVGAVCGQVADGCGGLTSSCGTCAGATSCKNGACVNACTPRDCTAAGAQCGFTSDGCGGAIDCGSCSGTDVCGYNNQANKCGSPIVH